MLGVFHSKFKCWALMAIASCPIHDNCMLEGEHWRNKHHCSSSEADVSGSKADVSGSKADVSGSKADVSGSKADVSGFGDVGFRSSTQPTLMIAIAPHYNHHIWRVEGDRSK